MNDRARIVDEETMKVGLLMESALAQQKLAEAHLEKLKVHTRDLDEVVRGEIRQTLVEELQSLTAEADRAAQALRGIQRTSRLRGMIWSLGIALPCVLIPASIARWMLPSLSSVAAVRAERDALAQNIANLERRGGKVDWRRCGDSARLCVRVERNAPIYGDKADYYIVKGY
jgi:hypothetical protein